MTSEAGANLRWVKLSIHVAALVFCVTTASAQLRLKPAPANIKTAEANGGPVEITINGVSELGAFRPLAYTIRNVGKQGIIGVVVAGLPVAPSQWTILDRPLMPGASRFVNHHKNMPPDDVVPDSIIKTDFVLFIDGSTWGPDAAGESEWLIGLQEGRKTVLADVKKVMGHKDDTALKAFIANGPYAHLDNADKRTKRLEGYARGYYAGLWAFRTSIEHRGDTKGIPARIADMEQDLRLSVGLDRSRKRISRRWDINEPVKIVGFRLGNKQIALDEGFQAEWGWPKDLRIEIRNNSEKNLTYLSLAIDLPETARTGTPQGFSMSYGVGPSGIARPEAFAQKPIAPGETFELVMDDYWFRSLKKFVESRQPLDEITRLDMNFQMITYGDGTGWSGGQETRQDPNDPKRYFPVKPNP